jgi:DNA-binding protein Fis
MAVHAIGKPLAPEACRLILDRTLELVTLRLLVRQHRQFLSGILASHASSINTLADSAATFVSFDAVLTSKLRDMVPHLEVLGQGTLHYMLLSHVEKLLITAVLTECRGNQLRAAEILGINRNTVRKKIQEFGILIPRGGSGAENSTGRQAQSKRRKG